MAVLGPNNFKLEYSFFVDPLLTIKDGESFDTPKELEMINATMYLNGKLVTEDTTDFKHGENVLTIKGTGDYEDIQIRFNYTNRNVENSLFIGIPTASITLVAAIWFFIRRRKVI